MNLFVYISHNIDRIKYDVRIGLVPCATLKHWQIYSRYDYYKRLQNTTSYAVSYTCDDFHVAQSWLYCIIKKMEMEL